MTEHQGRLPPDAFEGEDDVPDAGDRDAEANDGRAAPAEATNK